MITDFHAETAGAVVKQLRALADQLDKAPLTLVTANLHQAPPIEGMPQASPSTFTVVFHQATSE